MWIEREEESVCEKKIQWRERERERERGEK